MGFYLNKKVLCLDLASGQILKMDLCKVILFLALLGISCGAESKSPCQGCKDLVDGILKGLDKTKDLTSVNHGHVVLCAHVVTDQPTDTALNGFLVPLCELHTYVKTLTSVLAEPSVWECTNNASTPLVTTGANVPGSSVATQIPVNANLIQLFTPDTCQTSHVAHHQSKKKLKMKKRKLLKKKRRKKKKLKKRPKKKPRTKTNQSCKLKRGN